MSTDNRKRTRLYNGVTKEWQGMNWIRQEKRLAIYVRDQHTCQYCGLHLEDAPAGTASLDHLVPASRNGTNHQTNLVTVCAGCNSKRGDKPLDEFLSSATKLRQVMEQAAKPINVAYAKELLSAKRG